MTITRADVADLRAGDVVEYRHESWPEGSVIRGPLTGNGRSAALSVLGGLFTVRGVDGEPYLISGATLTVISRAKPPLYVNSDKTEPDPGDVVRNADDETGSRVWAFLPGSRTDSNPWGTAHPNFGGYDWLRSDRLPTRLRLLVDGRTGQTVPDVMGRP